jgi:hypothetical protein
MKKNGIAIVILSFLLLASAACKKKCVENELASYSFSSLDRKLIPYTGNEILMIDYNNGHFDSLKGTRKFNDFYNVYKSSSIKDCSDYYNLEYNRYYYPTLLTIKSALLIELAEEFTDPVFSYGQKYFSISIGATYAPGCFFAEKFLFNNDSIFVNNKEVHFYDSIALGSKIFHSVYELKERYPISLTFKYDKVYYNKINGLVALTDNGGNIVYVNKIE